MGWLGANREPDFRKARWLGGIIGGVLAMIFLLALVAAVAMLIRTIVNGLGESPAANLGTGALIVALLSSPFLIWNTVIRNSALGYQKEGHLTDRLSKAVEQLGAEKTVQNIGRPVTIWTGAHEEEEHFFRDGTPVELPPRSIELNRSRDHFTSEAGELVEGLDVRLRRWSAERTEIQWRGEEVDKRDWEHVGATGDWEVFTQTRPNIEVRIGGLLSLERIAQDSVTYDKGRDHVRVMEILCAYVRENAPASAAPDDNPREIWEAALADAKEELAPHIASRRGLGFQARELAHQRTGINPTYPDLREQVKSWVARLPRPREDIQLAVSIIGRRSIEQRNTEENWNNPTSRIFNTFDKDCPYLEIDPNDEELAPEEISSHSRKLELWKHEISGYSGYRIDLRGSNLQKAELTGLDLSGARLDECRMEGSAFVLSRLIASSLTKSKLDGANLLQAQFSGSNFSNTSLEGIELSIENLGPENKNLRRLSGGVLNFAHLEAATFYNVNAIYADIWGAKLDGTYLSKCNFSGATLGGASFVNANIHTSNFGGSTLDHARIEGAEASNIFFNKETTIDDVSFAFSILKDIDFRQTNLHYTQVSLAFGDASVLLPASFLPPPHWPKWDMPLFKFGRGFYDEYATWLASNKSYTPPPSPDGL